MLAESSNSEWLWFWGPEQTKNQMTMCIVDKLCYVCFVVFQKQVGEECNIRVVPDAHFRYHPGLSIRRGVTVSLLRHVRNKGGALGAKSAVGAEYPYCVRVSSLLLSPVALSRVVPESL